MTNLNKTKVLLILILLGTNVASNSIFDHLDFQPDDLQESGVLESFVNVNIHAMLLLIGASSLNTQHNQTVSRMFGGLIITLIDLNIMFASTFLEPALVSKALFYFSLVMSGLNALDCIREGEMQNYMLSQSRILTQEGLVRSRAIRFFEARQNPPLPQSQVSPDQENTNLFPASV